MKEEWRDVVGYEGLYQVSNLGRVRRMHSGRRDLPPTVLKPRKISTSRRKTNYLSVNLCRESKVRSYQVHRLVAQAFIPNPENKPQVNHIDGDPSNNNVKNLEWCTQKENIRHAFYKIHGSIGFLHEAVQIECIETGKIYPSIAEACRDIGVRHASLQRALSEEWRTCKGCHWKRLANANSMV